MDALALEIQARLDNVNEKIALAAQSSGRKFEDVRLVVVTKAQPIEVMQAAVEAGARILGENYPEESIAKIEAVGGVNGVEWHMIGHLQSRKASLVADHFTMLHSLDSLRLAERLNRRLVETGKKMPVMLEFNVAGEASKGGWDAAPGADWNNWRPDIEQILALPNLVIKGVMCMPPLFDEPELTRPFFVQARKVLDFLSNHFPDLGDWNEMSMGTSTDFEVAIHEGATYVRIGTAIVGARPKRG